jgi:hypothetical protein
MDIGLACFVCLISGVILFFLWLVFFEQLNDGFVALFVIGLSIAWWAWTGGIIYSFNSERSFYVVTTYEVQEINNIDVIVRGTEIKNMNKEFDRDLKDGEKVYELGERFKYPFYCANTWIVDENGKKKYIKEE